MVDLDNDGLPDIFIVTGGVYPEVAAKLPEYPVKCPRIIFRNLGNGKFEEILAGPVQELRPNMWAAVVHSATSTTMGT